jgi:hypothetical protein
LKNAWSDFEFEFSQNKYFIDKRVSLLKTNVQNIRENKETQRISVNIYPIVFNYVDALFPKAGIKNAMVFYSPRHVLNSCGFENAGGFYDQMNKIIVISDEIDNPYTSSYETVYKAKLTKDEILCHELIHYASNTIAPLYNLELEEEIAYGKSIPYLRCIKKYDNETIIKNNLLPYLISNINSIDIFRDFLLKEYDNEYLSTLNAEELKLIFRDNRSKIKKMCEEAARTNGYKLIEMNSNYKWEKLEGKKKNKIDVDSEI